MKKIFSLVTVSLLAMALVFTIPAKAFAASTDQAYDPFNPDVKNSLTVTYNAADTTFEDTEIQLYRVADFTADYEFVLTEEFASCGLDLANLDSSDQWKTVADTLESFVAANAPASVAKFKLSPSNVKAKFDGLTPGWYFIPQVLLVCENDDRTFSSVIATLPTVENGKWVYESETKPKSEKFVRTYKDIDYFINVVWDDKGYEQYRPESVIAHVTHTGGPEESENTAETPAVKNSPKAMTLGMNVISALATMGTGLSVSPTDAAVPSDVTISKDMDWHYEWTTKDDGTVWNVIGSEVEQYTLTVETVERGWILTYHIVPPPTPVPKTGEEFPWLPVMMLFVSGSVLVTFGVVSRRIVHD